MLNNLQQKTGNNIFTKTVLSPSNPIWVKMGSIPVLQYKTSSAWVYFSTVIEPFPDFTFLTSNNAIVSNAKLSNITKLNLALKNKIYWNMFNTKLFKLH